MTGPALSKQVKSLEQSLKVQLLTRTTRHISLTEEGQIFYQRCLKIMDDLADVERLVQDHKSMPQGKLRLSAPMSLGLSYLSKPLAEFTREYPLVEMDIDFDDRQVDILTDRYDVAIRVANLTDSTMIARKLADCPLIFCASPAYLAKYGTPDHPAELSQHKCLIFTRNGPMVDWHVKCPQGDYLSVHVTPHFQANISDMLVAACCQDIGIARLPLFSVSDELKSGQVVQILPEYISQPERHIYAIYPQNNYLPSKTRYLIDHLVDYFATPPWHNIVQD